MIKFIERIKQYPGTISATVVSIITALFLISLDFSGALSIFGFGFVLVALTGCVVVPNIIRLYRIEKYDADEDK